MVGEGVIERRTGPVTELRFDRPAKKNAITAEMYDALAEGLERAGRDEAVRVVLIGGEGGVFTAGNDLQDFLQRPALEGEPPVRRFMRALSTAEKPVVAAVDGLAIGIGTTLLLHCDLVLASRRARFQTPFVNLGVAPEFASSLLLPRRIGPQRAAEMLLLSRTLDAAEALACGLVGEVVEPDALQDRALALCAELAAKPPGALREAKRLLRPDAAEVAQRIQEENLVFSRQLTSPEAREAFQAFLEKRPPDFSRRG